KRFKEFIVLFNPESLNFRLDSVCNDVAALFNPSVTLGRLPESIFPSLSTAFIIELIFFVSSFGIETELSPEREFNALDNSLIGFPAELIFEKSTLPRLFNCFVSPEIFGVDILIPFKARIDDASLFTFEENADTLLVFIPEKALFTLFKVLTRLFRDFTARFASAATRISRLSTVPSAIIPPPIYMRLATASILRQVTEKTGYDLCFS